MNTPQQPDGGDRLRSDRTEVRRLTRAAMVAGYSLAVLGALMDVAAAVEWGAITLIGSLAAYAGTDASDFFVSLKHGRPRQ